MRTCSVPNMSDLTSNISRDRFSNVVHRTETPLLTACRLGLLEAARVLLDHGADPATPSLDSQMSSLHYAASKGYFGIVQLLTDAGCPLNNTSCFNFTPLTEAVLNAHYPVVQYLIQRGADLHAETEDDQTPLYLSMVIQDEQVACYLVRCGCDLRIYSLEFGEHKDEILSMAVSCSLYKLCRLLALAGCRVSASHVDMVSKQDYACQDFISWLTEFKLSGPLTLKRLCRIAVRNSFRKAVPNQTILGRINALPFPSFLKDFLSLEIL